MEFIEFAAKTFATTGGDFQFDLARIVKYPSIPATSKVGELLEEFPLFPARRPGELKEICVFDGSLTPGRQGSHGGPRTARRGPPHPDPMRGGADVMPGRSRDYVRPPPDRAGGPPISSARNQRPTSRVVKIVKPASIINCD